MNNVFRSYHHVVNEHFKTWNLSKKAKFYVFKLDFNILISLRIEKIAEVCKFTKVKFDIQHVGKRIIRLRVAKHP